jgi:transposase-like protein
MKQQRRFTKEFEEEAVRLMQTSGRTQREIAGDLGIAKSPLSSIHAREPLWLLRRPTSLAPTSAARHMRGDGRLST